MFGFGKSSVSIINKTFVSNFSVTQFFALATKFQCHSVLTLDNYVALWGLKSEANRSSINTN